ncbi:MAG: TRAP transporter large permease subunit [Acetobacteraceae bacterium]
MATRSTNETNRIDRHFSRAVAFVSAFVLIIEIALLLSNVIARYVFGDPLVLVDELSSVLFLWLAMLGAVLALRHAGHMRMTAIVNRASSTVSRVLDLISTFAVFGFLAFVLIPAVSYVQNEQAVTLTTMDLSLAWRAAAMPVGIALMLVSMLLQIRAWPGRLEVIAFVIVSAVFGGLMLLAPVFHTLGTLNLLIFFVGGAAVAVFAGIPIAFAFGLATLGYLGLSTYIPVSVLLSRMDAGMTSPVLLAIPLFVFLGLLIELTGMAQVMVNFLANLLGHVKGGLSYVLVAAIYLVSGISGSKAADMAAIAPVLFPEMIKRGMPRGDLVALLAATGAQTETIPPSLILITIGSVTGVSIASLFAGGVLPGIVGGIILCAVVWFRARKSTIPVLPRARPGALLRSFIVALPAIALPFVIRSAIVKGIATATEVSTIGIVYSLVVGALIYRKYDWRRLWPMLVQTATLSGAILLIVGAATAMAWAITQTGISRGLAQWILTVPGGSLSFFAMSILIFMVLGSVLEGIPAVVLMGPLLFPVAHQLGLNEIHYAMVVILSMGIGLFSPPFGVGYYVASAIGGAGPDEGLPHIGRYILALFVGLLVVAAFPWISTVMV